MGAPRLFHSLDDSDIVGRANPNVRIFIGDGTPFLRIGKCKRVDAVRIGGATLEATRTDKIVVNVAMETERVTNPQYQAERTPDGETILLRSITSNDGIWQKDLKVSIQGEWEQDEPDAVVASANDDEQGGRRGRREREKQVA